MPRTSRGCVSHDLRHTVITELAEMDVADHVLESITGPPVRAACGALLADPDRPQAPLPKWGGVSLQTLLDVVRPNRK